MEYFDKPIKVFNPSWAGHYKQPKICPYCGTGTDATLVDKYALSKGGGSYILAFTCKCTACGNIFFFACYRDAGDPDAASFALYPTQQEHFQSENIEKVSPRFCDLYNQALRAESSGDFDLAAAGCRIALEVLVKDYAINVLGKTKDDVCNKSLFTAIADYLQAPDLVKTADVVRILGNDRVHYEQKYPSLDYEILKKYMNIFLYLVEVRFMAENPPVSR